MIRNWKLEIGNWKLENGDWKIESGKCKVENGKCKLGSVSWKVGTGEQKPEGRSSRFMKQGSIRIAGFDFPVSISNFKSQISNFCMCRG
jgi:hypothetical protein